jgi:DNA topoisomerase-1
MKYQRMRLRYQLFNLDSKQKKKHPELADDESDLEEEFFERHEKSLLETAIEKATKKFERDNAKAIENKEEPQPESALKDKIKELKVENAKVIKERKAKKVDVGKGTYRLRCLFSSVVSSYTFFSNSGRRQNFDPDQEDG